MIIAVIGLGRMGQAIAHRLMEGGYQVVGFDPCEKTQQTMSGLGVRMVTTVQACAEQADYLWIMVPAGDPVDQVIKELLPACRPGSVMIDGGNSHFEDSIRRHALLQEKQVAFLDCGTSGGLKGETNGFSLMVGGDQSVYEQCLPFLRLIAARDGVEYMGPAGAGHYVKMVHNGIEYALLQAYAEGFDLLKHGHYKALDLERVASVWLNGSVIRSWIVELAQEIFAKDQNFTDISGAIGENKTGRWTVDEAERHQIPVDLIDRSLAIRAWSRETGGNYATKLVAMFRNKFGGHAVVKKDEEQ